MSKVYFVRHGESEHNKLKRYAGTIDSPLTDLGREQAKKTAELLKEKNITYILTSSMSRALDTASEIRKIIDPSGNIPFENTPLLKEVHFGDIQDEVYNEVKGINHGITSGTGDSAKELYERATAVLRLIESISAPGNILIVGHSSFTSVIFAVKNGKNEDDLIEYRNQWSFNNGEVKEL
ncbi:MAG: histidine phosphatase family protein [Patescibacteria group bacterium UBA2163]